MKTNKFLRLISVFTMLLFITSCVEDSDFSTPDTTISDPGLSANLTFKNVIDRYLTAVGDGDSVGKFELDEEELIIEGYVISSDKAGNFYEEIIIQNKTDDSTSAEDPRLGFNVSINVSSLSDTFEVGRKVYIKLNGLAIGLSHGVYTIGETDGSQINQIQAYNYLAHVVRSPDVATITPKIVQIGELSAADENTLIQLDNAQFDLIHLGSSYAGEASDEFDGFRTIKSCIDDTTLLLQTSTFADFKSITLPSDNGSIKGILSRDFGDDFNVLVINGTNDVVFTDTNRCDPDVLNCSGTSGGSTEIFFQNFESISNESELDGLGWTNINVNGGSNRWGYNTFSGNSYMQLSAYNSNENPLEGWLVTPAIDLDSTTEEELTFDVNVGYYNGSALSVLVSTDFTGDVTTATWTLINDVSLPTGPASGYGNFTTAGNINVSCLDGDVFFAFKYLGGDNGITSTFQVDNIKVTGSN